MATYVIKTKLEIQFQTHLRTRNRHVCVCVCVCGYNFKVQIVFYFFKNFFFKTQVWERFEIKASKGGPIQTSLLFLVIYQI
jgi:hypothetical protein